MACPYGCERFQDVDSRCAACNATDKNRTRQDAHERVIQAMIGSNVNSSDDFLLALKANLHGWIDLIDAELAKRIAAEKKAAANSEEDRINAEEDAREAYKEHFYDSDERP